MADKIAEIFNSGHLQKVQEVCKNEKAEVLALFNRGKTCTVKRQMIKGHLTIYGTIHI